MASGTLLTGQSPLASSSDPRALADTKVYGGAGQVDRGALGTPLSSIQPRQDIGHRHRHTRVSPQGSHEEAGRVEGEAGAGWRGFHRVL